MVFCHPSFGKVTPLELADRLDKADMIKALEEDEAMCSIVHQTSSFSS